MVRQSCQFFRSTDIDNQRIQESDWPKGTSGQTNQPREVVLNNTFH